MTRDSSLRDTLRAYYQLIKPGVTYGNVLTGVAGFLLASAGSIDWWLLIVTTLGLTLVIGGACALNNYLDQDIDSKMERTQQRPSVTGMIPGRHIVIYALVLAIVGTSLLWYWTNPLTVVIAVLGFVTYVWLYGAWSKRRSIHGTLVGSISGALPIAGGYAAVGGHIDIGLAIVFLIMFFWQFPEFFSIAMYRRKEYAAAGIPVMPVVEGTRSTIIQINIYTLAYVLSTLSLTLFGYTGWIYFMVMAITGSYWLVLGLYGIIVPDSDAWARKMFKMAMWSLLLLSVMVAIGPVLP